MSRRRIYFKKQSPVLLLLIFLSLAWLLVSYVLKPNEAFFPKPFKVYTTFCRLIMESEFWKDVGASFYRVMIGFIVSVLVAYPIVMYSIINVNFKKIAFFLTEFFRYLPVPVFIPLTILWFGVDDSAKIFIVFLGTFAQMIPLFYDSAMQLENRFKATPAALKWSAKEKVKHLIIPGSAPLIWDNSRICFGWAWTYLVIAELLGAENGLGYAIIRSQRYLAIDSIFVYVMAIGIIGLLSDRLMVFSKRLLFKWED